MREVRLQPGSCFQVVAFFVGKEADRRGKSGKTIEKTNEIRLRD